MRALHGPDTRKRLVLRTTLRLPSGRILRATKTLGRV
jgi:hypothetical protein